VLIGKLKRTFKKTLGTSQSGILISDIYYAKNNYNKVSALSGHYVVRKVNMYTYYMPNNEKAGPQRRKTT